MDDHTTTQTTTQTTRRTRFVCISDTHNATVKLPRGDVLIHAGDLTNMGSYTELSKQINWLYKQPFEHKIIIAGNHDLTLDTAFYNEHGLNYHNANPQSPSDCQNLLLSCPDIVYLNHTSAIIKLASPNGPHTTFTVFGSPYTPKMTTNSALWAFQYPANDHAAAHGIWKDVPLDTDVLITHGPARMHRDEQYLRKDGSGGGPGGCEALRQAMWRIRPRLAVCGHIHEGRGAERVRWDLESANVKFKENSIGTWEDPGEGNKKLCLVDLSRKGGKPLDNDGSRCVMATSGSQDDLGLNADAFPGIGVQGLGGNPSSARSDQEALMGRLGRAETCVVNCAVTAGSYPHRGPRKLVKPIVIDIDLPVWE